MMDVMETSPRACGNPIKGCNKGTDHTNNAEYLVKPRIDTMRGRAMRIDRMCILLNYEQDLVCTGLISLTWKLAH